MIKIIVTEHFVLRIMTVEVVDGLPDLLVVRAHAEVGLRQYDANVEREGVVGGGHLLVSDGRILPH